MRWLVQVGDEVVVDQPVAEVETAKSVVEVPSPFGGTISALHGEEGEDLRVGAPLIEVDAGGDARLRRHRSPNRQPSAQGTSSSATEPPRPGTQVAAVVRHSWAHPPALSSSRLP